MSPVARRLLLPRSALAGCLAPKQIPLRATPCVAAIAPETRTLTPPSLGSWRGSNGGLVCARTSRGRFRVTVQLPAPAQDPSNAILCFTPQRPPPPPSPATATTHDTYLRFMLFWQRGGHGRMCGSWVLSRSVRHHRPGWHNESTRADRDKEGGAGLFRPRHLGRGPGRPVVSAMSRECRCHRSMFSSRWTHRLALPPLQTHASSKRGGGAPTRRTRLMAHHTAWSSSATN